MESMQVHLLEMWQLICEKCNLESAIGLVSCCKMFYSNGLYIYEMMASKQITEKITNEILQQSKFSKLKSLYLTDNLHVTDLSALKNLEILFAERKCVINQKSIEKINLKHLYAVNNKRITNVSHMTNLELLDASGKSGITQEGIRNLNLTILFTSNNPKITNCSHMTKLKI